MKKLLLLLLLSGCCINQDIPEDCYDPDIQVWVIRCWENGHEYKLRYIAYERLPLAEEIKLCE